jgi:hypothetical protein
MIALRVRTAGCFASNAGESLMARYLAAAPSRTALLAIASVLLFGASATHAQRVYTLAGKFASNQGRAINFPLFGDVPCPTLQIGPGGGTGYYGSQKPAAPHGCVGGAGRVTTTGKGVAGAFALPVNAFGQAAPGTPHWLPVDYGNPTRRQYSTSNAFAGPPAARAGPPGSMANGMNTAAFRAFRADAWSTQTGRVAPDFTWCPGDPTCAAATVHDPIVIYRAGPHRFGGTMAMLMSAGAHRSQSIIAGTAKVGVVFAPIRATGSRPTGAGYAVKRIDPATVGSVFAMYMTAMVPSKATGKITMGTTYVAPFPVGSFKNYGLPFTTGDVLIRGDSSTITARGFDAVTAMGARNISLVAGGIAYSGTAGAWSPRLGQMVLPEPGSAALLAGAMMLVALARAGR